LQNEIKNRIVIHRDYHSGDNSIFGNEGKLHQAFMNILANAIQAIPGTGDIYIHSECTEGLLKLVINDTGTGINSKNLPRIFDLFFTTKDPGKGSGMGLSITYDIVREHKGTIQIESEEGKGTKVILCFTLHKT
jgi:signal transduction histidine kinase